MPRNRDDEALEEESHGEDEAGEEGEEEELAVGIRRSTRQAYTSMRAISSTKQKRQDALQELKQARSQGRARRTIVEEDIYEELTEEEYQARRAKQRDFVERAGGVGGGRGDYGDSSDEEEEEGDAFDEFDDEQELTRRKGTRRVSGRGNGAGGAHSGPTIKSMFQAASGKGTKTAQSEQSINLDEDDYLNECLAGITGTTSSARTPGTSSKGPLSEVTGGEASSAKRARHHFEPFVPEPEPVVVTEKVATLQPPPMRPSEDRVMKRAVPTERPAASNTAPSVISIEPAEPQVDEEIRGEFCTGCAKKNRTFSF